MKYVVLPLSLATLTLAACSNESDYAGAEESMEIADAAMPVLPTESESPGVVPGSPNIAPTSAPGVAFNYSYAFRVPDGQIAGVQEEHAAACETLGVNRCRITGMRYRLIDEKTVQAMLAFKLDPEIARKFGKDAIASVEKAEGILVDSAIQGIDVGSQITASQRRSANVSADLKRIELRLKAGGLGDRERTELQGQAARLREQLTRETASRQAGEESLATTPMQFSYRGGEGIPGFESGNPFAGAWDSALGSFVMMASFVMLAIGVALPWILLLMAIALVWRSPLARPARSWWKNFPAKSGGDPADA